VIPVKHIRPITPPLASIAGQQTLPIIDNTFGGRKKKKSSSATPKRTYKDALG